MLPLPPIHSSAAVSAPSEAAKPKQTSAGGGGNTFEQLLAQANQDQLQSNQAIQELVTGKNDNVQQVVMQVVKSEMSFQLFMEVRNQLIESYNELMRMQF